MASKLEAIQKRFLWGSFGDVFKHHLMKWNIVKQPFPIDGLGIVDLSIFNEALLGKWLLWFMNEKDKHWRAVVKAKYGAEALD